MPRLSGRISALTFSISLILSPKVGIRVCNSKYEQAGGNIRKKTPLKDVINFYPILINELGSMGYRYFEDLKDEGWEKICRRYAKVFPERLNQDIFLTLLASFNEIPRRKITQDQVVQVQKLIKKIKQENEVPTGKQKLKKKK